jgi:hypothetical protein
MSDANASDTAWLVIVSCGMGDLVFTVVSDVCGPERRVFCAARLAHI